MGNDRGNSLLQRSDVKISHSVFRNNTSEDALNIIRSDFSIEFTLFSNTVGDALDSDFSLGSIVTLI